MTTIALLPDVGSFMGAIASIMIGLLVLIYLACRIGGNDAQPVKIAKKEIAIPFSAW